MSYIKKATSKKRSAKKDTEKKTFVTSVRMSEEQHKQVQKNAKKHNMTVSNYMITTSVNGENGIAPDAMVRFQNMMNSVYAMCEKYEPQKLEEYRKQVNEIWPK